MPKTRSRRGNDTSRIMQECRKTAPIDCPAEAKILPRRYQSILDLDTETSNNCLRRT
jgi:hypothetical protein